jgi:hypothetical protein
MLDHVPEEDKRSQMFTIHAIVNVKIAYPVVAG